MPRDFARAHIKSPHNYAMISNHYSIFMAKFVLVTTFQFATHRQKSYSNSFFSVVAPGVHTKKK